MTVSVHMEDRLLVINPDQSEGYDLTEEEAIVALCKMRLTCQYLREQIAKTGQQDIDSMDFLAKDLELAE